MANRRGKRGSSDRFPFLGLQNCCSWWLKPWNQKTIASWQGSMTNLDSVLKSRQPTYVCIAKAMVFPVIRYSYESWAVKKAKHKRIEDFKLWCWRRLLKVPWTVPRKSNQSILSEINPVYSLERLMLRLKLQYFGHLIRTDGSLEKSLMLGKIEGRRGRGHQRMRWLDGITNASMNLGKLWEMVRSGRPGVSELDTVGDWTMTTSLIHHGMRWHLVILTSLRQIAFICDQDPTFPIPNPLNLD